LAWKVIKTEDLPDDLSVEIERHDNHQW